MLKIEEKYIGTTLIQGNSRMVLNDELSQRELLYIKNRISDKYVTEFNEFEGEIEAEIAVEHIIDEPIIEEGIIEPKPKRKKK